MKTLLIRAEDKNIWERRAAIIPGDLKEILQKTQADAYIEKSDKRVFKEEEYVQAGAQITEGMEKGDVIFGVKEIPTEKILNNKVYLYFSHTIKGQQDNMPMLKKIIDSGSTLIDYEKITDDQGRRLVFFGRYAGDAGALDILWLMGEYWQAKGIDTPFKTCQQANRYHSVEEAKNFLTTVGEQIKNDGLPPELAPLTIGVLGYGNVSQGAQQVFDCLPTQRVAPEELAALVQGNNWNRHTVYITVFKEEHLVKSKNGQPFELQDYYQHPEKYEAQFEQYLPYLSIIVNATYWTKRYPRFVTWDALEKLYRRQKNPKLQGIADITCDINGSIECNVKATDSGMPAYRVQPLDKRIEDGHTGEGIVLLAVDNLPAELPRDASTFFSRQLKPFVPAILQSDLSKPLEDSGLPDEIKRAVIVYNGRLTENFIYLNEYLAR